MDDSCYSHFSFAHLVQMHKPFKTVTVSSEGMVFEYVSTESTLLRKINRKVEKLDGYSSSTCLLLPR